MGMLRQWIDRGKLWGDVDNQTEVAKHPLVILYKLSPTHWIFRNSKGPKFLLIRAMWFVEKFNPQGHGPKLCPDTLLNFDNWCQNQ